jgi:LmbE family N-acetylglucosaminyl deacetylase
VVTAIGQPAWERLARSARPVDEARLRALSPMLILSPHPDDETLGCGGIIAAAADLGLRPRVAYLTDGSASHPGSAAWPRARLARIREREALGALAVLGVPRADVLFLRWRDAAPFAPGSAGYARTLKRLSTWASSFAPRSVWSPWAGEAHCDHAAANGIARDLETSLEPRPLFMTYLVWGWARRDLADHHGAARVWRLACGGTVPRRIHALSRHRTQMASGTGDAPRGFRIPPKLAALARRPSEIHLESR